MLSGLKAGLRRMRAQDDPERDHLREEWRRLAPSLAGLPVLDVGCGYGRNLRELRALGVSALGVDLNPETVAALRREGFDALTPDELARDPSRRFGGLLASHVVEHFTPHDLIRTLDGYLDRLPAGAPVVIATPLLTSYFFDDFDHVRPYPPEAFEMVFGARHPQVQMRSRHVLTRERLWYRPACYTVRPAPTLARKLANLALYLSHRATGRALGTYDGWTGTFRKADASAALLPYDSGRTS